VAAEWLTSDQLEQAAVLWITDDTIPSEGLTRALALGVPLLAMETNTKMKAICAQERCGLYYESTAEAIAVLRYLAEHEEVRAALGRNGAEYASSEKREKAVRGVA
jgi:glycosyltransferase involved in cell wall biosynthesis